MVILFKLKKKLILSKMFLTFFEKSAQLTLLKLHKMNFYILNLIFSSDVSEISSIPHDWPPMITI